MTTLVAWLEALPLSLAMRQIVWLWPLMEILHFLGLGVLIGGAGFLDLRLMGFFPRVPINVVRAFMPYAITAFTINLVTGVAFFVMAPGMYAFSTIWWVKVAFIAVAGLNAMVFETFLSDRIQTIAHGDDTPTLFKVVGAVSLASWFVVLYCGRMLPYLGTGN